MSQLIACKNDTGIVLAADSKAVAFDAAGNLRDLEINRLVQLTPNTAILAGGAAVCESMCLALRDFIDGETLVNIEDVYTASLPFLATEYERFMRKACEHLPVDPLHHVHFILGGLSAAKAATPFQLYLIWAKRRLPLLDGDEIASAFSVPRLMSLEHRLARLSSEGKPVEALLPEVRRSMERQAQAGEDIGGPCTYALITRRGFEKVPA
jgi:hypothetical protein